MPMMPDLRPRSITVPPVGNPRSNIAFVGEAPGKMEVRNMEPFTGPAGSTIFNPCLHAAGIARTSCYITNLFKFQVQKKSGVIYTPDDQRLWSSSGGFTKLGWEYIRELGRELAKCKANIIVALGAPAAEALTGIREITKYRGSIVPATLEAIEGHKVILTLHPASALYYDYGEVAEKGLSKDKSLNKYYIVADLKKALRQSTFPEIRPLNQEFLIHPSTGELATRFTRVREFRRRLNYDIELINRQVSCLSFSTGLTESVCVPFHYVEITEYEEARYLKIIARILEDENVPKVNQNLIFDAYVMAYRNKILTRGRWDDPMIAYSILYPDFKKGLDSIASIYTNITYYKDDGKVWKKPILTEDAKVKFWNYNCQDSAVSIASMDELDKELDADQSYRTLYEWTMLLCKPLLYMMLRGTKLDKAGLLLENTRLTEEAKTLQSELNQIAGEELNVDSPKQCTQYFYIKKGIKPYINRRTERPTCNDKALARLAKGTESRKPVKEAKLVQQIRRIRKLTSDFTEMSVDPDGRVRCNYNPRGTVNIRLSSSRTLLGQGRNMQNIPARIKEYFKPDPGYVFVEIDKRQAEWVVVAFVSADSHMLEIIYKGLDPHSRTGNLLSGIDMKTVVTEDKVIGKETDEVRIAKLRKEYFPELVDAAKRGEIFLPRTFSIRQCGKHANHGLNYGLTAGGFSIQYGTTRKEAEAITTKYHQAYPGIRNNFHEEVKDSIDTTRTLTNCFGFKRRFYGKITTALYLACFDYIPQSTVGFIINAGLCLMYYDTSPDMQKVQLLHQTHDSLLFQYPEDDKIALANVILKSMLYLNPLLSYRARHFTIANDIKIGYDWKNMEEISIDNMLDQADLPTYTFTFAKPNRYIKEIIEDTNSYLYDKHNPIKL